MHFDSRFSLALSVCCLTLLWVACGQKSGAEKEHAAPRASNMPAFQLQNMQGESVAFAQLAGAPTVVDFWATWCKPCLKEIPAFNGFYAKYGSEKVRMIGIAMDSGNAENVLAFAREHHIAYPVYVGSDDAPAAFGGVEGFPKTFLLDRDGNILKSWLGAQPGKVEEIEQMVDALLQKESAGL